MTSEEILEGNTMIAKFMNWHHHENTEYDAYEMSKLKYHTSWDRLMPVVEKIEQLGFIVEILSSTNTVHECNIFGGMDLKEIEGRSIIKLEAVYQAVLQFITWYNTQSVT